MKSPKAARTCSSAPSTFSARTLLPTRSASSTAAPYSRNMPEIMLLPEAMLPVSPMSILIRGPADSGRQKGESRGGSKGVSPVSYTHLRAHETRHDLVCRLLLEKKKNKKIKKT